MSEEKPRKHSPVERTLKECARNGWPAGVVERWKPGFRKNKETGEGERIPYGTRVDFLGFADVMALDGLGGYLAINACQPNEVQAHLRKAMELDTLREHLAQGNRFQVWAWRQIWISTGPKTKAMRWKPRVVSVVLRDGMLFHEEGEILSEGGDAPRLRTPESTTLSNSAPSDTDPPGPQPELFAKEE